MGKTVPDIWPVNTTPFSKRPIFATLIISGHYPQIQLVLEGPDDKPVKRGRGAKWPSTILVCRNCQWPIDHIVEDPQEHAEGCPPKKTRRKG